MALGPSCSDYLKEKIIVCFSNTVLPVQYHVVQSNDLIKISALVLNSCEYNYHHLFYRGTALI